MIGEPFATIRPELVQTVQEPILRAQTAGSRHRLFSLGFQRLRMRPRAQRLPNGNTLITEGADGRIFELTAEKEIVWEYVNPFFGTENGRTNRIYRAHRVPYDWVPQLERPEERPVVPPDVSDFRIEPQ